MIRPLVSIITPTVPARRDTLLTRCRPSVLSQTYQNLEHIVVLDGPDGDGFDIEAQLNNPVPPRQEAVVVKLGRNWHQFSHGASYGAMPRLVGTGLARGEYIGYLDDDDEFLPYHVEKLVNAIESQQLHFAFSIFKRHWSDGRPPDLIGSQIAYGCIGTPIVMHRAECLLYANWGMNGYAEDFALFDAWAKAGLKYARVPEVTVNVYKQV